jgi:hypothetical protein
MGNDMHQPPRNINKSEHKRSLSACVSLGLIVLCCELMPIPLAAQPTNALPDVPTTKILAIGTLTSRATQQSVGQVLPQEVRDTVQLYLRGQIDQWYSRRDESGVVFIMNVDSVTRARQILEQLPLGQGNLMQFELIPIGPLSPLSILAPPVK